MTPLEVTVKTLAEHRLEASCAWRVGTAGFRAWCTCGWNSDQLPTAEVRHGKESATGIKHHDSHVAGMLAAAGVVMGIQEWGVRAARLAEQRSPIFLDRESADQMMSDWPANITPYLVTRFTGATAWTAEGSGG